MTMNPIKIAESLLIITLITGCASSSPQANAPSVTGETSNSDPSQINFSDYEIRWSKSNPNIGLIVKLGTPADVNPDDGGNGILSYLTGGGIAFKIRKTSDNFSDCDIIAVQAISSAISNNECHLVIMGHDKNGVFRQEYLDQ